MIVQRFWYNTGSLGQTVGQTDGMISCLCHSIYRTIPILCCATLGKNCVCYDYGDSFQNVSRVLYATCIWEFHLHVLCVAKNSRLSYSVCGLPKHFSRYKSFPVCDRQTDRQGIAVGWNRVDISTPLLVGARFSYDWCRNLKVRSVPLKRAKTHHLKSKIHFSREGRASSQTPLVVGGEILHAPFRSWCSVTGLRIILSIQCAQRITGFTTMRYINLRFTYLLTYLLTYLHQLLDLDAETASL